MLIQFSIPYPAQQQNFVTCKNWCFGEDMLSWEDLRCQGGGVVSLSDAFLVLTQIRPPSPEEPGSPRIRELPLSLADSSPDHCLLMSLARLPGSSVRLGLWHGLLWLAPALLSSCVFVEKLFLLSEPATALESAVPKCEELSYLSISGENVSAACPGKTHFSSC